MKKTVLITGGSEGLGFEVAKLLTTDFNVVVVSNKPEMLENTKKELNCEAFFCDVTNPQAIETILTDVVAKFGTIDVLVNNAGIFLGGELDSCTYENIAAVIGVNVLGTINVTRAVLPKMKSQKSGHIINIGSTNGIESKTERSVYSASKWAITGFTKCLRKELQKYNINVALVNPGLMQTGLHTNAGVQRDMNGSMLAGDAAKVIEYLIKNPQIDVENVTFRSIDAQIF